MVHLDIVDHYNLEIECYDHDLLSAPELIGKCQVSLLPVYKKGKIDTWVTIKNANDWGNPSPAGDLHIVFEFEGPMGVAYPQDQPTVDSFDERERIQILQAVSQREEQI